MLRIYRWADGAVLSLFIEHLFDVSTSDFVSLTTAVHVEEACIRHGLHGTAREICGDNFTVEPQSFERWKALAKLRVTGQDCSQKSRSHESLCDALGREKLNQR